MGNKRERTTKQWDALVKRAKAAVRNRGGLVLEDFINPDTGEGYTREELETKRGFRYRAPKGNQIGGGVLDGDAEGLSGGVDGLSSTDVTTSREGL